MAFIKEEIHIPDFSDEETKMFKKRKRHETYEEDNFEMEHNNEDYDQDALLYENKANSKFLLSCQDVLTLIRLRGIELVHLFQGKCNKTAWGLIKNKLNTDCSIRVLSKKWSNLVQKYKRLKDPLGANFVDDKQKPITWPFYDAMEEIFGYNITSYSSSPLLSPSSAQPSTSFSQPNSWGMIEKENSSNEKVDNEYETNSFESHNKKLNTKKRAKKIQPKKGSSENNNTSVGHIMESENGMVKKCSRLYEDTNETVIPDYEKYESNDGFYEGNDDEECSQDSSQCVPLNNADIKKLIKLRGIEYEHLFAGKSNRQAWLFIRSKLNSNSSVKIISKKWSNLVQKYKRLKNILNGKPTDEELKMIETWPFYQSMDAVFSQHDNVTPRILIASSSAGEAETSSILPTSPFQYTPQDSNCDSCGRKRKYSNEKRRNKYKKILLTQNNRMLKLLNEFVVVNGGRGLMEEIEVSLSDLSSDED